jgi:hypothetical protein
LLSASPSPAPGPWGIPDEDALDDFLLGVDELCDVAVLALEVGVLLVWLGLEPHPATTRAVMTSAPAASRRITERGREFMFFSFWKSSC